jgi:hypothetical protein
MDSEKYATSSLEEIQNWMEKSFIVHDKWVEWFDGRN